MNDGRSAAGTAIAVMIQSAIPRVLPLGVVGHASAGAQPAAPRERRYLRYHAAPSSTNEAARKYGRHSASHGAAAMPPMPTASAMSGPMQQSDAASAVSNPPARSHDCFFDFTRAAYALDHGIGSSDMTIGELAKQAGVNVQTVRFYERTKLLPEPHRWPDSGYRDYDEEALLRLRFIRSAKHLGFTLSEIRELLELRILPGESCREVKHLLKTKLCDIDARMKEMRRLRRVLEKLVSACQHRRRKTNCPALWAIER